MSHTPTFCKNVDWDVSRDVSEALSSSDAEQQLIAMYTDFEGSRHCKRWFQELMCRYAFPLCNDVDQRPCRSECERFSRACPGALQPCESFPETEAEGCYSVEGLSPAPALTPGAAATAAGVVLSAVVAAAIF